MPTEVGIIYAKAEVDINAALQRLDQFENRLRQIEGRKISVNVQSAVKGLQSMSKAAGFAWDAYSNLTTGIQRFGDSMVHYGQVMATWSYRMMLATAPIAGFGVASIKMAAELETSMAMVATQLDLRGADLDEFIDTATEGFVELSTEIPIAAKDMGDALYYLVSSMTIDPEIAEQFIEPISKAAVAGKSTAKEVAESITPILNVYKDLAKDSETVEHVLDVLFETVKRGRGEFSDIAVQVGDFVQFAEQAGATFEEAMAAFAMATRVTTPAQAATWIANLYRAFITPTGIAALQEMGIQTSEIVADTGQWITKTVELTDAQRDQAAVLRDRLAVAQERVKEATLDVNIAVGKAESTWDEYTGSVITSLETGALIDGVSKTGINAFQRLQSAQKDVIEIQGELAGVTARVGEEYQAWTGEKVLRPSLEMMKEIAAAVGAMKSEEEKLLALQPIFPRIRSMQGALLFIANLEEIIAWEEEFTEATGITQEAFEIMVATIQSKAEILKNTVLALGLDVIAQYEDDIKRVLDAFTDLFKAVMDLPAGMKSKLAAIAAMLVAAGPVALGGSVVVMGIGALIQLFGSLISLPSLAILTAVGVLFGDKIPIFLDAVGAYGMNLEGFATAIADMAVGLGIISESDAIGILEDLGITVDSLDSEKIDTLVEGIGDIQETISRGIEDLKEWVEAFGLFLDDVKNREGAVGTLVGYIERMVAALAGAVLPEGAVYEEWGAEEKAGIIDKFLGFLVGSKIASGVLAGLASTLKTGAMVAVLLKGFGVIGTGAGATAAAGGATASAGTAIGVSMGGAILAGLGSVFVATAILAILSPVVERVLLWLAKRFPQLGEVTPAIELPEEQMMRIPAFLEVSPVEVPEGYVDPLTQAWNNVFEWLRDYPIETVLGDMFADVDLETVFDPGQMYEDAVNEHRSMIEGALKKPYKDAEEPVLGIIHEWEMKIEGATRDRDMYIEIDHDELALDTIWEKVRDIEGRHMVDFVFRTFGELPPTGGEAQHFGGYPMDWGGYPPANIANLLPSEFVLSPYTTDVLESYLGRLNQEKVRGMVTHAPVEIHAHFYKGSVTKREDAEEAADALFDIVADRARGLAHMEA